MIVYRVEVKDVKANVPNVGKGPYGGSGIAYKLCSDSYDDRHPTPSMEARLRYWFDSDWVCCFKSIDNLHNWFDLIDTADVSVQDACHIATYQVPDSSYKEGRWQSIALASDMKLIEVHPITYRG